MRIFFVVLLFLISSNAQSRVILVENGEPRFVIVVADESSDIVLHSAEELNLWVKKISGIRLPIVKASQWDGETPYIAIGESILTVKNGWDREPFDQEEARVFIEKEKIGLLGNDRSPFIDIQWQGTYYAVNEFVRKSLGVRWIWPTESGEVYERRSTISVAEERWNWKPQLRLVRSLNLSGWLVSNKSILNYYSKEFNMDLSVIPDWLTKRDALSAGHYSWSKRKRLGIVSDVRFGHAFGNWWERFGDDHPDWFAKPPMGITQYGGKGVKLNISNPDVHEQIILDWRALWELDSAANRYLRASPNDSRGFDTRPETRAWDASDMQRFSDKEIFNGSEPILSDRYVKLWNILARKIRDISPEAQLSTYAYRNYRQPPLGNERLEDNIVISYVGGEGYYPDEPHIRQEWQQWAEKGARMVWRPNLFHAGHGTPYLYSKSLFGDMKFFMQHDIEGFNFDSMIGNWAGQGLNYYIVSELHIRPLATYEELTNEYFSAFGPARETIETYHKYFEELTKRTPQLMRENNLVSHETWGGWWKAHIRVIPLVFKPEVISKGEALLEMARKEVKSSDKVYRDRIDLVARGLMHSKIMAEVFRELKLHDPTVNIDFMKSKKVLQPLWDFRMQYLSHLAFPSERYIFEEHRQFGIWQAFAESGEKAIINEHTIILDKEWKFRLDSTDIGTLQNWQLMEESNLWQNIQVGKPWRQALPQCPESRIGWYAVNFEVPELEDTGQRVYLSFESVDAEVKIWVNGEMVNERSYPHNGNYDSWDEEFRVDVTGFSKTADHNLLTMRVESDRPGAGITGKVLLVVY